MEKKQDYYESMEPYTLGLYEVFDEHGALLRFATTTPFYDACFKQYKEKSRVKECYKKSLVLHSIILK